MLTYKLDLPEEYKIHPVFHTWLLKPATVNDLELFLEWEPLYPDPVFLDKEEYKVEKILNYCKVQNELEFLVY